MGKHLGHLLQRVGHRLGTLMVAVNYFSVATNPPVEQGQLLPNSKTFLSDSIHGFLVLLLLIKLAAVGELL